MVWATITQHLNRTNTLTKYGRSWISWISFTSHEHKSNFFVNTIVQNIWNPSILLDKALNVCRCCYYSLMTNKSLYKWQRALYGFRSPPTYLPFHTTCSCRSPRSKICVSHNRTTRIAAAHTRGYSYLIKSASKHWEHLSDHLQNYPTPSPRLKSHAVW